MNMIPQVAAATKETCLTIVCIFEDKMAAPTLLGGGMEGGCLLVRRGVERGEEASCHLSRLHDNRGAIIGGLAR